MTAVAHEERTETLDEAELEALRESVAGMLAEECNSRAVHLWLDRENELGPVLWRQAVELGWLALALPEGDGGLGLGARGLTLLNRELGARTAPGPFLPTLCIAQWLSRVGSEAQRAELVAGAVTGEHSFALPAILEGVGRLSLVDGKVSGEIQVLGVADAAFAVVPVSDGGKSAWAVVRIADGTASLERCESWDLTREIYQLRCSDAPTVALISDADGTAGALLGSYVAVAIAADSLGAADNIAHKTVDYLKERVQFDRPIGSFQALKHRAADLIGKITTQDALLEQAVQSLDGGSPDAAMWARLSKAGATEAFAFVAADCIQLHGGVGHTWEYDPHIYIKRARLNEALLNSNRALRDTAVQLLDRALGEGRTTTELDS
jgi:alkylation response protein AidB-like acyl-CoA dehydrogenase